MTSQQCHSYCHSRAKTKHQPAVLYEVVRQDAAAPPPGAAAAPRHLRPSQPPAPVPPLPGGVRHRPPPGEARGPHPPRRQAPLLRLQVGQGGPGGHLAQPLPGQAHLSHGGSGQQSRRPGRTSSSSLPSWLLPTPPCRQPRSFDTLLTNSPQAGINKKTYSLLDLEGREIHCTSGLPWCPARP